MADDVQAITGPVNGVTPLAAARLCNFRTGEHAPRDTHIEWINNTLKNAVAGSPNPWVDIYAYASRRGTKTGYDNQALSERRRGAIHEAIVTAIPRTGLIKQDKAFGASRSGGGANDNDGYWRAVEVYAYGELPKKREPDPVPPPPPPKPRPNPTPMPRPDWWVNSFSVGGLSLVIEVGGGFADGTIGFENLTSGETITDHIRIGGFSVGESVGVDKLKKVVDILAKSSIAKKAIDWVVNSLSAGRESWPSWAVGPVWPMPGHSNLTGNDFLGTCFSVFVNAAAGPGNGGFYLMFMGKQESFAAFVAWVIAALSMPAIGPAMMASSIMGNAHAITIFPAASIGLGASIGITASAWAGRIF
ncbi:MAG TPA: hypothetical protein VKT99_13705 [Xanthobacteraceae bacterium]|jgi:hypothetical protein|nr:hypothetical protein [Xanthobacteraceae bacterium]